MTTTRAAQRRGWSVVVKLTATPPEVIGRLAQLLTTPPILGAGEHDGAQYLVQRAVMGSHPDPAWFVDNLTRWAPFVWQYLHDPALSELVYQYASKRVHRR